MTKSTEDKPYTERLGGSYVRDAATGKATLVERTADLPATQPAPAPAEPAAQPTPGEPKKQAKRSD